MSQTKIVSELAGIVWTVEMQKGEQISEHQVLVIVESMKMEIPITSPSSGTIVEILVDKGDAVYEGQHIATIER